MCDVVLCDHNEGHIPKILEQKPLFVAELKTFIDEIDLFMYPLIDAFTRNEVPEISDTVMCKIAELINQIKLWITKAEKFVEELSKQQKCKSPIQKAGKTGLEFKIDILTKDQQWLEELKETYTKLRESC